MAEPTVSIKVITDASQAVAGVSDVTGALDKIGSEAKAAADKVDSSFKDMGESAKDSAKKVRDVSGGIETVGDTAGRATTGLRDMSDAVAMAGFPEFAAGMGIAATGLESLDGAANLYKASQEALTNGGKKVLDMLKGSTIATNVFAGAQKAAAFATSGFGKAMNFLKTSILTNPIFWIVAIIIGIVVAFVMLYKKCEAFRKIVDAVFHFVWNLIKAVWSWIKTAFAALLGILRKPFDIWKTVASAVFNWLKDAISAVVGWIADKITRIIDAYKAVFDKVKDVIASAIGWIKDAIAGLVDKLKGIVDKIKDIFAKVFNAIKDPFKKAIDWVKDHFKLPSLPSWIPGVGKSSVTFTPMMGRSPHVRAATSGNVTITINGPIDAHSTVRELRRLFRDDQVRLGRSVFRQPVAI